MMLRKIGLRLAVIMFAFLFLEALAHSAPTSEIRINEVAPSETGGYDWIEFHNASGGSINISNWQVFEGSKLVKTFPPYTMASGEYIVLNFNSSAIDETMNDTNGNGYRDFYTDDKGLTGTDNVITLKDGAGTIIENVRFPPKVVPLEAVFIVILWKCSKSPLVAADGGLGQSKEREKGLNNPLSPPPYR